MRKFALKATVLVSIALASTVVLADAKQIADGKILSYNSSKGNCLACHSMPTMADALQPGNSGPPLVAMKERFPKKEVLRAKIWDATETYPQTMMPILGKHGALTETEIDAVLEFVYGL